MSLRGGFVILLVAIIAIILAMLAVNALNSPGQPAATASPSASPGASVAVPTITVLIPTTAPTPVASSISTPPPSLMEPATDLVVSDIDKSGFVLHFEYPEAGEVLPAEFHIDVNGQTYDTYEFEGVGSPYSLGISDQQCGSTVSVQVVAVNGEETSSSDVLRVPLGAC